MDSMKRITKYAYFCLPLEWPNPLNAIIRENLKEKTPNIEIVDV